MLENPLLTPDDLTDLPRRRGVRGHELVRGRVLPIADLTAEPWRVRQRVFRLLTNHVIARHLPGTIMCDVGFVLGLHRDPSCTRLADIAFVHRDHFDRHNEPDRAIRGAPPLVIEIITAGARKPEATQRMIDFLEAGVAALWMLDACTREALVYNTGRNGRTARVGEAIDAAPALPALRVDLASLFGLP